MLLTLLVVLSTTAAHAQWLTFDASNLAQSIVNSTNEVFETATTASHMLNNFKETVKIYEQGKKYFDALRSVNNLVRDARKVQQCVLMVGEMSDIYVNNFRKMLADSNFSAEELTAIASGYTLLLRGQLSAGRAETADIGHDAAHERLRTDADDRQGVSGHNTLPQSAPLLHPQDNIGLLPSAARPPAIQRGWQPSHGSQQERYY